MRELLKQANPTELASLPPNELARAILFAMSERARDPLRGMANCDLISEIFTIENTDPNIHRQRDLSERLERALHRALEQLEQDGLIERAPGTSGDNGYIVLSPEGKRVVSPLGFYEITTRAFLGPEKLHRKLRGKPHKDFASGDMGSAVFEAFKIVEIEVRQAADYPETEFGQNMMLKAFGENGPLTDMNESKPTREALARLFAGSIGRFENPGSHRHRSFDETLEAIEELLLASRLLRFLDKIAIDGVIVTSSSNVTSSAYHPRLVTKPFVHSAPAAAKTRRR